MNDDDTSLADGPIDATDQAALRVLRRHLTDTDAPPAGMLDRIKFAMSVRALEAEVARLISEVDQPAGVRATIYDRTSTLTFSSDNLSIMVSWEDVGNGHVEISGWTSVGSVEVEMRERSCTRTTVSDAQGRFRFESVDRGLVHFVFRRDPADGFAPVITPAVEL
jgi:hypothetical protein